MTERLQFIYMELFPRLGDTDGSLPFVGSTGCSASSSSVKEMIEF